MAIPVQQNKFTPLSVLLMWLLVSTTLLSISQFALAEKLAEESNNAAIEIVQQLHTQLLEVMQAGDTMTFEERYAKLEPTISEIFYTPLIAKVILSRYWKDLTHEQQTNFIDLFNRQSTATYASRFDSFDGEVFKINTIEQLKKGRLLIRSEIQSNSDDPVNLDYLMHNNNDKWYIISVIADGVNDLSLKRAEYSTIIKENGYDYLVTSIEQKITELGDKNDK